MKATITLAACSIAVLAAFQTWAGVPAQTTIGDLASTLQTQRDVCTKMAAEAKRTYELALFKSGLDRDTAALKAQMDTRVYGVGHGSRETSEYYTQQLKNVMAEQQSRDRTTNDAFLFDGQSVTKCVSDLKEKGKVTYVAFKQRNANKTVRLQAEALMSAWLANVSEISTGTPNGADASFTIWKAEKAHAEVSSL